MVNGKITKVSGDEKHPISRGYICARGLATQKIHHDPDRLKYPVKLENGKWNKVSWDDALADIGRRLKSIRERYGPDSVAFYIGNPLSYDFAYNMFIPFAIKAIESRNIYATGSQDCNNKFVVAEKLFGSQLIQPIPDIEKTDFLIFFGTNPALSHSSFLSMPRPVERLREIIKRGGRVISVDPRRNETVKLVGEHIFIRPDTDIYLLLAMLHVIIFEELYDKEEVSGHLRGFEELKDLAAKYPPKRIAAVTGIGQKVIEDLARDFAGAKNAGIHGSLGINVNNFGTLNYWLIQCLNAVTGRFDRRGSMLFVDGIFDVSKGAQFSGKGQAPPVSRIGGYRPILGMLPAGVLADEILTPGEGQIKALIVMGGNPMMTVPGPDKLKKAFKSLDLLVSLDFFINETGGLSDYVLPCKDFYERWDFAMTSLMFNPVRYINYTDPVVKTDGESRDTWLILHNILKEAGYHLGGNKILSLIFDNLEKLGGKLGFLEPLSFLPKLLLRAMLLGREVSFKKLKNSHQGVVLKDHTTGSFFRKRILTPDKKIDVAPHEFMAEGDEIESFFMKEKRYKGLKMIGQRQRRTHNSWFHNVRSFMEKEVTNRVSTNPKDAFALKIKDGDMAEVRSRFGHIRIPVLINDDVMPGVVSIPHGWGHDMPSGLTVARKYPGVNVNKLLPAGPGKLERLAGIAKLTGIRVSVKKA